MSFMRFITLAACLALALIRQSSGEGITPAQYPNPMDDPEACGNEVPMWCCDPAKYLGGNAGRVQIILNDIRRNTTVQCEDGSRKGFQLAVAIVNKMDPSWGPVDIGSKAEAFATDLGQQWGVGDPGCGNGLILFLAVADRAIYIRTAPQASRRVTSSRVEEVLNRMRPYLRAGDYKSAVEGACILLGEMLTSEPGPWWLTPECIISGIVIIAVLCLGGLWRLIVAFLYMVVIFPLYAIAWIVAAFCDCTRFYLCSCCHRKEERRAQEALDLVARNLADIPPPPPGASAPPLRTEPPPYDGPGDEDADSGVRRRQLSAGLSSSLNPQPAGDVRTQDMSRACPICLDTLIPATNPSLTADDGADVADRNSRARLLQEQAQLGPSPVRTLQCGHKYHAQCIAEWFQQGRQSSCPLCRAESGEDDALDDSPPAEGETLEHTRYRRRVDFYMRQLRRRFPRTFRSGTTRYRQAFLASDFRGSDHYSCAATGMQRPLILAPRIRHVNSPLPLPRFEDVYGPVATIMRPLGQSNSQPATSRAQAGSSARHHHASGGFGGGGNFSASGSGGGGGRW